MRGGRQVIVEPHRYEGKSLIYDKIVWFYL
jgi:hypothetical protein